LRRRACSFTPTPAAKLHFRYEGDNYELLTYADDLQYVGIRATYQLLGGVRRSHAVTEANDVTRRAM
jgi:hypothetical protein